IPQHDDAGAVAFGDDALEAAVLDRVIFDVHRQPLGLRIERGSLRHGPRHQDAVVLETEVVVEMTGEMLLDAEEELFRLLLRDDLALRLRTVLEVALAAVFLEGHSEILDELQDVRIAESQN